MRIIIDVRTINDHFPGIGRYTCQLARAIAETKDRGELVLLSNPGAGARLGLHERDSQSDVRIVHTAARPFSAGEQLFVAGKLRKLGPSVTHFPYTILPYLAPRPIVLTLHDVIPLKFPQFFTPGRRVLYRAALKMALRRAAIVICVSDSTKSDLQSLLGVDPSRCRTIHEGAGKSFHPCPPEEIERVRAAHNLPDRYILYVGSNKPHKNLPALINAYARIQSAAPLALAGAEDSRYRETRMLVERLGLQNRVLFLGPVQEHDLPGLYSGAGSFVFPSLYEGFGLPPLEAMACGIPVACSGIPSLREVAGGNGALFFDPKDLSSIAAAVDRVEKDESLRQDLRMRGLHRAAELSWESAAQRTLEAYRLAAKQG